MNEQTSKTPWKPIAYVVAVVALFLAGFIPQYLRANHLDEQLATVRQEHQQLQQHERMLQLRGGINQVYVQMTRNNFGLASTNASSFFDQVRAQANQTSDAGTKEFLEKIAARRDVVISGLAKVDPGVKEPIEQIVDEVTRRVPVN